MIFKTLLKDFNRLFHSWITIYGHHNMWKDTESLNLNQMLFKASIKDAPKRYHKYTAKKNSHDGSESNKKLKTWYAISIIFINFNNSNFFLIVVHVHAI